MLTCPKCNQSKDVSEFYPSVLKTAYKQCKKCSNTQSREWAANNRDAERARVRKYHAENRERLNEYARWQRFQRKYGVSKDQYVVMLASQEHQCKICDRPLINQGRVCIDHSHKTNKVRGILCDRCNRGIGLLQDNPTVLNKAAQYISASL